MKLEVHKGSKVTCSGFSGKLSFLPKLGQKRAKWNFWPYCPNASFILVKIWQDLLENDFEYNDRDFGCGKIFIGPNLGQKGAKIVQKCNFWPCYPNASFLLVEIWQDLLENDFEDNARDFGCGKMFIGCILGQNGEKESENATFGHIIQMLRFF